MAGITVVARLTAKPEAIAAVRMELVKMIAPTRAEEGCLEYRLHQDNDDPAIFMFYETWQDMACFDRHRETDHYRRYVAAVGDLLVDKAVQKLTEIG